MGARQKRQRKPRVDPLEKMRVLLSIMEHFNHVADETMTTIDGALGSKKITHSSRVLDVEEHELYSACIQSLKKLVAVDDEQEEEHPDTLPFRRK